MDKLNFNLKQNQNLNINMLQRLQRNNLDQIVAIARDELSRGLLTFKDISSRTALLSTTASNILDMYSNMSYPLVGFQVIKQNLTNTKHPHGFQIELILNKAQLFYIESVKHDLDKLKQGQKIQHLIEENIKQYIQEINWKLGFERQTILNESQEIGDNIDLMKFFQGVRNYQNWEQNLQKKTLQKLKNFARNTENQLKLRKGFLISRIQHIYQSQLHNRKLEFMIKLKRNSALSNKLSVFGKIAKRNQRQTLLLIQIVTKSKNIATKFKQFVHKYTVRSNHDVLLKNFKQLAKKLNNAKKIANSLQKIQQTSLLKSQFLFMKKFITKAYLKFSKLGSGVEKFNKISKKIIVRQLIKDNGIQFLKLVRLVNKLHENRISQSFANIIEYIKNKIAMKEAISYKIKGKILLSIQKYENKPINIRKTFLNWYLKSKEQKYSKMIYNIWLNGSTSKFTFLMRIKNALNQSKKLKIKQQLKVFLIVLMQNMNNYYNNCQKGFINKWLDIHRRCKKLSHFISQLSQKASVADKQQLKQSFDLIKEETKRKKVLTRYFNKMVQSKQIKCQQSFNIWKRVPNIKKLRGRQLFLTYLRRNLDQLQQDQKQSFQIFKKNHIEGQNIKIKFVSKVFAKDIGYKASFLNIWRRNYQQNKSKNQRKDQKTSILRNNSTTIVLSGLRNILINNLKQAFTNIVRRSKFLQYRKQSSHRKLRHLIQNSYLTNLNSSYNVFKANNQQGKIKKNKLVYSLVNANKCKQAQSLNIWLAGAKVARQNQKKMKVINAFMLLNQSVRPVLDNLIAGKSVHRYLQRLNNNYQINVRSFISNMRKLPSRIDWNKRKNTGILFSNLESLIKKDKNKSFERFKQNHYNAQFKKKKIMGFMYYQYVDCTKRYFKSYLQTTRQAKMNQKYNAIVKVFQSCNNVQRISFDVFIAGESIWKKKSQKFNKLNVKLLERIRHAFKLWQNTAKALAFFTTINNEKKSRVIGKLSEMLSKNKFSETKKCLNLFKKNSNIMQLQTNFLKRLCDTQAGKVIKALMIWKNLPKPKNKQIIAKASKFQRNLFNFASKLLRGTYTKFKDDHYFGNDRKKMAIRNLVAKSCTGIQKYFQIWKKNNKLTTLFSQCHKVQSFFQRISLVEAKKFSLLIYDDKSIKVQESLSKINGWWQRKMLRMLRLWRNKVQLLKADDNNKAQKILTISNLQSKIERIKAQNIITKLKKLMFLKSILSKHFIQRAKINLFQSIKNISNLPDRNVIKKNKNKRKAAIQFINILQQQVRKDKIKVLQIYRDIRYVGNFKKLKSCQQYLKDKISQVHQILVLWQNLARIDKKEARQRAVQNLFSSSNLICYSNFSQILQSLKSTQVKKRSIQKLFNALQIKKKGFFNIWRSKIKQMKLSQMIDMNQKKSILQKINKLLHGSSQQNIKKALRNFYLHSKVSQIQVRFIQRLLQTKSGKVLQAFNKWKKIPNQNLMQKYKKGQKFFFKLQGLIKSKLLQTHQNFMQNSQQGSTLKKQSVLQLLDITSSGIRRYYNRWIRITKRDHTLKQAYSMMHSLDALHYCITENYKIIFEDQRNTRIKTWAIQKLILASGLNIKNYLLKWKQAARQMKIQQQLSKAQKKTALKIFTNVISGSQTAQIKQILQRFHKNLSISKISKNFIQRLLKTKSGKVVQLFELWKSIPDAKVAKKKKKAIKFESNLNRMFMKFMKAGFQPFKISSHQARNRKKTCIQKLIRASMGEEKKKFLLWRQIVKQQKMLAHTHIFDNIFERLNKNLSDSIMIMIKNSTEQVSKKKNLCRRLINNSNFAQHHAYLVWKQALQVDNVKIERIQSKVKTNLLNMINIGAKLQNRKLIQIISLFNRKYVLKNRVIADIVKQKKNKKAILFYQYLSIYAKDKIGVFLKQLSKNHKQMQFISKSLSLQKSFQNLKSVYAQNMKIVIRSSKQTVILERALNKLFQNFKASTQRAFNMWRQYKNILNLQNKINSQKKKGVLQVLNRFLKKNQQTIKIPYVIQRFEKNYRSLKLRKQILTKILRTKAGKVPLAFMIWKTLPNPGAKKMKQKGMKFQSSLYHLVMKGLKSSYEKFKNYEYQGNNKKKFAVRKLILVTMSDSNRVFNKWRQITGEMKITQKVLNLTKFFEDNNQKFVQNFSLFNNFKNDIRIKQNAIRRIYDNTALNLSQVIGCWKSVVKIQNNQFIKQTLLRLHPENYNKQLTRYAFDRIKKKADIQVLRIYINSLWKWKMSNVEANYYAKFIKVFRQSEQLITLSNCINKRKYENIHYSFRKIILEGVDRRQRKIRITEKYLMRKVNNYFQRFKLNACFQQINTWRNMYKSTIKGKKLIDLIEKFARQQLYNAFQQISSIQFLKRNGQKFDKKLQKFNQLLLKSAFNKINIAGPAKICNKISDIINKISLRLKDESFKVLSTTTKVEKFAFSIQKIIQKLLKKNAFTKIHSKSIFIVKSRLAINLISYMQQQRNIRKLQVIINKFKNRSQKAVAIKIISHLLLKKKQQNQRQFYKIIKQGLDRKILLTRFKKGMILKKILDKQDKKVLKKMFDLLKKKQNIWISKSVKKFILRSDLKSSLAVSLWRLRNYSQFAS